MHHPSISYPSSGHASAVTGVHVFAAVEEDMVGVPDSSQRIGRHEPLTHAAHSADEALSYQCVLVAIALRTADPVTSVSAPGTPLTSTVCMGGGVCQVVFSAICCVV